MPKGFKKRRSQKPIEVEIEIKNATADNIVRAQQEVNRAATALSLARNQLDAVMRSLLTERGIAEARPLKITDTKPRRLVVEVVKYAKPEKNS